MTALSVLEAAPAACCEDEEWRLIPAWPHHGASTCGRVRSVTWLDENGIWHLGAILPQHPDKRKGKGYLYADLRDGGRRRKAHVAVLVLEAHRGLKPGPDYEACHSNGRTDNHLRHLRWDTREANLAEMWEARRAVTDPVTEALQCHRSQVRGGPVDPVVCHSRSVTGDSSPGTVRVPFLSTLPFHFLSLTSSLRSLCSLRSDRRPVS